MLRRAVLRHAETEHRRTHPALLHLGTPGATRITVTDDHDLDHGLRTEIVGAALRSLGGDVPLVWLTRAGPLTLQDTDAAWLGPAVAATAEREEDLTFVVVTRSGWLDPRSGARREWRRIRQR
jgi:hypothetical protein